MVRGVGQAVYDVLICNILIYRGTGRRPGQRG
jgi:hypothetical protein